MNKRIGPLVVTAVVLAGVGLAQAQERRSIPRIGVLLPSPTGVKTYFVWFRQGLKELGYVEGQNIIIEHRIAEPASGDYGQYAKLATELVKLDVDVIVTASPAAIQAVKNATTTIPIVMGAVADPVETGLVDSLARPGGNVTGLSLRSPDITGKRLELLKEIIPRIRRVGVLWNPINAGHPVNLRDSQAVAQTMELQLHSVALRDPTDFERGFKSLTEGRTDAFTVLRDSFLLVHSKRIVEFAAKSRMPAIYDGTAFVLAGGLMSYAAHQLDMWRRAAIYVDKILKGAKPMDLPVEQPMRTEFIINLKAAKEIGLTIPPEVLQRADKVIR
jgi:putative ABC transport system substrate-binding protein